MPDNVLPDTEKVTVLLSENDPGLLAKILEIQEWNLAAALAKIDY